MTLCCGLLAAGRAPAQDVPGAAAGAARAAAFSKGVDAFEAGRYAEAIPPLLRVFNADAAFAQADLGSAAYWLGRCYQDTHQPEVAARAWEQGWAALAEKGLFDLRLADAYVWNVFERQDSVRYLAASSVYLALLENLDGALPAGGDVLRARHLAPLALILPSEALAETGLTEARALAPEGLAEGQGAHLAAWWRSMDSQPATPRNERLEEHLERVVYARAHFADRRNAAGYDDRGRIYLRLGPPSGKTPITYDEMQEAPFGGARLSGGRADGSAPEGEFWVYDHVDETAQYLFVREWGKSYRLGLPVDLLPAALRLGQANMGLLIKMEGIYRKLSLYHPGGNFLSYYEQIAGYTGMMADLRIARSLPDPYPEDIVVYRAQPPSPAGFAFSTLSRAHAEDRRAARRRDEQVPASYSNSFGAAESLPVALRWARFLDDDGTTRTELYWGLPVRALHPSRRLLRRLGEEAADAAAGYLLDFTVVRQAEDYQVRAREARRLHIPEVRDAQDAAIPVQTDVVRGGTGRYHLALQWDVYRAAPSEAGEGKRDPRLKVGSYRIDTLAALRRDPAVLEMSDLKPVLAADETRWSDEAAPYPGTAVTPASHLGLYFEVYHLGYGADDWTHYAVSYEVVRREKQGGLLRFLKRETTVETAAETRTTGDSRSVRETILLDRSAWEGSGRFEVNVRVTDETTGQTVERSLAFDVVE